LRNSFLAGLFACALLLCSLAPARADSTTDEALKSLPDKAGDFVALGAARPSASALEAKKDAYEIELIASRSYRSAKGERFKVDFIKTRTDRGAYSLYSSEMQKLSSEATKLDGVGTAAVIGSSGRALFYKGMMFVSISDESGGKNTDGLTSLAKLLAEPLDKGEGEIPVLVKHLPDWETAQQRAVYVLNLNTLREAAGNRPALDVVNFAGGVDAVTATYGPSRLVIIEHNTPQLATDNDARINARLSELRNSGQPVPSGYRRVGNYAVFVFDAPDEATATQLVDKVAYEQVVQWLGNNPHLFERARREYSETTAGVILSVIKASGISLLICLGIGGIFGSIIFRRRRAQQAVSEAYSDAGGMMRLNLDDITTAKVDPSRLLGKRDG
jgi:hypothetical protein